MMRSWLLVAAALSFAACDGPVLGSDGGRPSPRVDGGALAHDAGAAPDPDVGTMPDEGPLPGPTDGCGLSPVHSVGGVQVEEAFSAAAGGTRSFFLTLPEDYDPQQRHRVVVVFAGTNWSGRMIRPYFDLERAEDTIYLYPDLRFRDFDGWGNLGGWLLGPHADPADGIEDIELVRELLDSLAARYCVDESRVFATGHSWGGDMAAVVGCFLGDRFTAVAPAAANRPYWFEPDAGEVACVGSAAVWTWFGQNETHFTGQDYAGQFGDEQNDFWRAKHGCAEDSRILAVGGGDCLEWTRCAPTTRYCFYDPSAGHQIPGYFTEAVMDWFASF